MEEFAVEGLVVGVEGRVFGDGFVAGAVLHLFVVVRIERGVVRWAVILYWWLMM